ncbi:MAG: hypothetical protein H6739_12115 [Alphaproteobacteria bacterium]|nr:hypothetical protein [Alphaproteobacteria bacterium]
MAHQLPTPHPLAPVTRALSRGATLMCPVRPSTLADLLGGRAWVCGLATLADRAAPLSADPAAAALGLPWHQRGDALPWVALPLSARAIARSVRVPVDRMPVGPLETWVPRLRRDDGSPAGIYQGDGLGPGPRRLPELLLSAPTPLPVGARLFERRDDDRALALLTPAGWSLEQDLPRARAAQLSAVLGPLRPTPLPRADDAPELDFRRPPATLSDAQRALTLACAAPGHLWDAVADRFTRFDWIQLDASERHTILQHQGGAALEVWLNRAGRVVAATLIEGEDALRLDLSLGGWHRQGRPLLDFPEATELVFEEQRGDERRLTLSLAPDGWVWVRSAQGPIERAWTGRVDRSTRARLFQGLRAAGFPKAPSGPADATRRVVLCGDGREQIAALPADLGAQHPYSPVLSQLESLRDTVTRGALRPEAARAVG